MDSKNFGFYWLLVSLSILNAASAEKITLDLNSDEGEEFYEIDCIYNDGVSDLWIYGCNPALVSGVPSGKKGFWGPCEHKICNIYYYGGEQTAPAKELTFSLFVKGDAEIIVHSKYTPFEEEYKTEVGRMTFRNNSAAWFDGSMDLNKITNRAHFLKFTVTTSRPMDNLLLLDKITVDLGDDQTFPPELPPTTTPLPFDEKSSVITLDKDDEYWVVWGENCTYVDDYKDMWVYGCPATPREDSNFAQNKVGFWSSCIQARCRLQYKPNRDVTIDPVPKSITIVSHIKGKARIDIMLQKSSLDFQCKNCERIGRVPSSTIDGWTETNIPIVREIHSKDFVRTR